MEGSQFERTTQAPNLFYSDAKQIDATDDHFGVTVSAVGGEAAVVEAAVAAAGVVAVAAV